MFTGWCLGGVNPSGDLFVLLQESLSVLLRLQVGVYRLGDFLKRNEWRLVSQRRPSYDYCSARSLADVQAIRQRGRALNVERFW